MKHVSSATVAAGLVIASAGSVRLAEEGSAFDFTVSTGTAALPLNFTVLAPGRFSWARASTISVRFSTSQAAAVTAKLISPRGKSLRTWKLSVKTGSSRSFCGCPFPPAGPAATRPLDQEGRGPPSPDDRSPDLEQAPA